MKSHIEKFLLANNLLYKDKTIVIGFSGGLDSMCLADILIKLSKIHKFKIVLAHLNHNWRGEKSYNEAENCKNFAKTNNVDFYTETLSEELPHTETIAREERYKFFVNVAHKYNTDIVLTAHTKSDNIETVLQRIIKGTGISGLSGIPSLRTVENVNIYRPLLDFDRQSILDYCQSNNLSPNNDNSNEDTNYFRNKIRHNLIPELKENYDKNFEYAISRLIQNAKDSEEITNNYLKSELSKISVDDKIITRKFLDLNLPLQKLIIKNLLTNNNLDYNQKRITDVIKFIEDASLYKSGKTFSLADNLWLFTNTKTINLVKKNNYNFQTVQYELNLNGETYVKEFDVTIKITKWDDTVPNEFPKENENIAYVDLSNIKFPLVVRTRIDGDKIVPFGKHSAIKLKKYLNNKGLSKHDKSKVLLISSPKEVLWVINVGISNNIRVNSMPTHKLEFIHKEQC